MSSNKLEKLTKFMRTNIHAIRTHAFSDGTYRYIKVYDNYVNILNSLEEIMKARKRVEAAVKAQKLRDSKFRKKVKEKARRDAKKVAALAIENLKKKPQAVPLMDAP